MNTEPPPFSTTILAITGHRQLQNQAALKASIRSVFTDLLPTRLTLLSPLAEGTDRLAAHEILSIPGSILQAVLPLPPGDYIYDFATAESRADFHDLLARASNVEILPSLPTRSESYNAVGCHIVNTCDILLAVWNGLPAQGMGGTAEVVAYARKRGKPLIIIDSENPALIARERLSDMGGE